MFRYVYVSHGNLYERNARTDLDAVASIAIMWRGAMMKGLERGPDFEVDMIDYYANGLDELLRYRNASLFVADVPPDALARPDEPRVTARFEETLRTLRDQGNRLNLIDHHPVSPRTAARFDRYVRQGLIESATLSGMDHEIDRVRPHHQKQCAAEMTREMLEGRFRMPPDEVIRRLAWYAHDADFGIRRIPEASRLSILIGADYPPLQLAGRLAQGEFWNDDLQGIFDDYQAKTRRILASLKLLRRRWRLKSGRVVPVVYALMPAREDLKVTPAGMYCLNEQGASVAVMVQRRAFLSLRIDPEEIELHAGRMLANLGGGGHQGAASAGRHPRDFPYHEAHEGNFADVVASIDRALTRFAGARAV
jgi:hypothetical protein